MKLLRVLCAALLAGALASAPAADRLVTPSYEVSIEVRCAEGVVACDDVRYTGVHRATGKSITLRGRSVHTRCADGVTPCRFLGHVFRSGDARYMVWESGVLEVRRGARLVLQEQGAWQ
ncbi:MAG: hypothetical protein JNM90_07480 [Burkholderiales bacterium]|nr:hypothetical protein [Burkholderiales bacterium]